MRSSSTRLGQRLLARNLTLRSTSSRTPFRLPASLASRPLVASQPINFHLPFRIPIRHASSIPSQSESMSPSTSLSDPSQASTSPAKTPPSYHLTFTCKPCTHRSTHRVTKQGYHRGTVLITCPACHARHVISDHLYIFMDEASTLEDILQRKAGPGGDLRKLLKKGRLGMREGELVGREGEESIEFWDDGSETPHEPAENKKEAESS